MSVTNVVVKNQYSIKQANGKGTHGSSPTKYIANYMSRASATVSVDKYINNYMRVNKVSGDKTGVAFTKNSLIATEDELVRASEAIQKRYDDGHPFMKTVVSFDNDYLIESGILPVGFTPKKRGDFIGNVDEARLREAVKSACDKLGKGFGDLEYVGCIHLDTKHVHVHLCMADTKGVRIYQKGTKVGEEHGKITPKELRLFKLHVADSISNDRMRMIHLQDVVEAKHAIEFEDIFDINVDMDKLIQMLPPEKRLWRYDSNAKSVQPAKDYLSDVFKKVYDDDLRQSFSGLAEHESASTGESKTKVLNRIVDTYERKFVNNCMTKAKTQSKRRGKSVLMSVSKSQLNKAAKQAKAILATSKALMDYINEKNNQAVVDFIDELQNASFDMDVADMPEFVAKYDAVSQWLLDNNKPIDSLSAIELLYVDCKTQLKGQSKPVQNTPAPDINKSMEEEVPVAPDGFDI